MYQCSKCGGNLKFDITEQALKCEYCSTLLDPYSVEKEEDAVFDEYDVNVFHCPQCGARLLTQDDSAADFCSYCGASTILSSRISHRKKPSIIIPFKKTKDECKQLYLDYIKKAIYMPSVFRNIDSLEEFRGIYIPYWSYNIAQHADLRIKGENEFQSVLLGGKLDATYTGVTHDAASAFRDDISERIAPYQIEDGKKFTPSYLSGFYADVDDVSAETYEQSMLESVNLNTYGFIMSDENSVLYNAEIAKKDMNEVFGTQIEKKEHAFFPVWFMAFRRGKRVAYATVNGQTGKVAADMPVDYTKFAIGSILIGMVLFAVFNFIFTFRTETALNMTVVITWLLSRVYVNELEEMVIKNNQLNDRGILAKKGKSKEYKSIENLRNSKKGRWDFLTEDIVGTIAMSLTLYIPLVFLPLAIAYTTFAESSGNMRAMQFLVFSIFYILMISQISKMIYSVRSLKQKPILGMAGFMLFAAISLVLVLVDPAEAFFYYAGIVVALICVLGVCISLINNYNMLSTREMPQFDAHKGGDDDAN